MEKVGILQINQNVYGEQGGVCVGRALPHLKHANLAAPLYFFTTTHTHSIHMDT